MSAMGQKQTNEIVRQGPRMTHTAPQLRNTGNTSNITYELARVPLGAAFAARPPTLPGFARLLLCGGQLERYRPVIRGTSF
jgi:hypothetical protein